MLCVAPVGLIQNTAEYFEHFVSVIVLGVTRKALAALDAQQLLCLAGGDLLYCCRYISTVILDTMLDCWWKQLFGWRKLVVSLLLHQSRDAQSTCCKTPDLIGHSTTIVLSWKRSIVMLQIHQRSYTWHNAWLLVKTAFRLEKIGRVFVISQAQLYLTQHSIASQNGLQMVR